MVLSELRHFTVLSAPGDLTVDGWTVTAQRAGGVFDGELLLLRFPCQSHDVAVERES